MRYLTVLRKIKFYRHLYNCDVFYGMCMLASNFCESVTLVFLNILHWLSLCIFSVVLVLLGLCEQTCLFHLIRYWHCRSSTASHYPSETFRHHIPCACLVQVLLNGRSQLHIQFTYMLIYLIQCTYAWKASWHMLYTLMTCISYSDRLKLNADKTEFIWLGIHQLSEVPLSPYNANGQGTCPWRRDRQRSAHRYSRMERRL